MWRFRKLYRMSKKLRRHSRWHCRKRVLNIFFVTSRSDRPPNELLRKKSQQVSPFCQKFSFQSELDRRSWNSLYLYRNPFILKHPRVYYSFVIRNILSPKYRIKTRVYVNCRLLLGLLSRRHSFLFLTTFHSLFECLVNKSKKTREAIKWNLYSFVASEVLYDVRRNGSAWWQEFVSLFAFRRWKFPNRDENSRISQCNARDKRKKIGRASPIEWRKLFTGGN